MPQLKRFENAAQLLRHIAAETDRPLDELWDEYTEQRGPVSETIGRGRD